MKGIILAGGSGTRLYPLTQIISKQLLPVYDKPMISYPLSTLIAFDIKDILIISTPKDTPIIENFLGNGDKFGLNIQYAIQNHPNGIAEAFLIGENFIKDDDVCLILGDNILYMNGTKIDTFKTEINKNKGKNATIFAYHVSDPSRFGVIEFDKDNKIISIEEKPKNPKSNFVSIGLYFYPSNVVSKTKTLKPSARGELEITDLNNLYLKENKISVVPLGRGNAWLDAGTPDSLMDASNFIQIIEKREGLKIACIEEIVYRKGFIDDKKFLEVISQFKEGTDYRKYLENVYKENK